jgi:hypothetical protein
VTSYRAPRPNRSSQVVTSARPTRGIKRVRPNPGHRGIRTSDGFLSHTAETVRPGAHYRLQFPSSPTRAPQTPRCPAPFPHGAAETDRPRTTAPAHDRGHRRGGTEWMGFTYRRPFPCCLVSGVLPNPRERGEPHRHPAEVITESWEPRYRSTRRGGGSTR